MGISIPSECCFQNAAFSSFFPLSSLQLLTCMSSRGACRKGEIAEMSIYTVLTIIFKDEIISLKI